MSEEKILERLNQERITTRLQKQEIQKLEAQNNKLLKKLNELKQQGIKREQEIQEEEQEIQQREEQVKENYASIKACLNGNINEKIQENIQLSEELKVTKTLKDQLEKENNLLRDSNQNLQEKVNEITKELIEKNNTIANLNMIVKLQATRIEGFMADNAHHLEQNLKLNRLLEASSKKISPEQSSSRDIQKSINAFLKKPNQSTSSSQPTYTLFDYSKKTIKRPLEEFSIQNSSKSNQRITRHNSDENEDCYIVGSPTIENFASSPSFKRKNSPELGASPYSCVDFEEQNENAVLFDVSLSPVKRTEKPLVYLDDNTFSDSLSYKSEENNSPKKEASPQQYNSPKGDTLPEKDALASPKRETLSQKDDSPQKDTSKRSPLEKDTLLGKGKRTSTDILNRISQLDELRGKENQEKPKTTIATNRVPLSNATNQIKSKMNMRPLLTHKHGKDATCIACEKFYDTGTLQDVENECTDITPKNRIQLHSRHRVRATTPPEFWNLGFPYTLSP